MKAALDKVFAGKLDKVEEEDAQATNEDAKSAGNGDLGGTIEVALKGAKRLARNVSEMVGAVAKQSPAPIPTKKKPKMRKVENGLGSWEGKLEARIETKTKAENDDDETQEITGKLLITDLRGDEPKVLEETLICPNCEKPLT